MVAVTHPRVAARRAGRASGWWARAFARAVEEASYGEADLKAGRTLARAGAVGGVTVDGGTFVAAVTEDEEPWTVSGTVEVWDDGSAATLVELVAAQSRRIGELLAGELPLSLVEDAEEAGVELVPYAGELGATCTCHSWTDPCRHALAVLLVLARLIDGDPLVLLHLRGLDREELLARLHARTVPVTASAGAGADDGAPSSGSDEDADLETGLDAVLRARRVLELLGRGEVSVSHLL